MDKVYLRKMRGAQNGCGVLLIMLLSWLFMWARLPIPATPSGLSFFYEPPLPAIAVDDVQLIASAQVTDGGTLMGGFSAQWWRQGDEETVQDTMLDWVRSQAAMYGMPQAYYILLPWPGEYARVYGVFFLPD